MNPNALRLRRWEHRVKSWMWGQRQRLFRAIVRWLDRTLRTGIVFEDLDTFYLRAGRRLTIGMVGDRIDQTELVANDTLHMTIHTYSGGEEFPIPTTVAILIGEPAERYLNAENALNPREEEVNGSR